MMITFYKNLFSTKLSIAIYILKIKKKKKKTMKQKKKKKKKCSLTKKATSLQNQ